MGMNYKLVVVVLVCFVALNISDNLFSTSFMTMIHSYVERREPKLRSAVTRGLEIWRGEGGDTYILGGGEKGKGPPDFCSRENKNKNKTF